GGGILLAFILTITLLPALITVMRPGQEKAAVGFESLRPLNAWHVNRRPMVLAVFAIFSAVTILGLFMLRFDFDPLHLKDPESESMSTLMALAADPWTTPYTLNALTSGPEEALQVAQKLDALPEVRNAMTIF